MLNGMANTTPRSAPGSHHTDHTPPAPDGLLGRGLLPLMATATGMSVAGLYFAQPLLDLISRDLHVSATLAGLIVTAAQAGYALGLILLVPLGDVVDRRRLAVTLFAVTAAFLALTAAAPNGPLLLAGTALTALTCVGAQVVVPLAAALAAPAERGRVVGTVMAGILLGGLLARTASGTLAALGGWRTVYWVSALLMAVMAVLLHARLPRLPATAEGLSYSALLRSTLALLRTERQLRWRAAMAALLLASFSAQLTSLTFLLAGPSYGWSEAAIGLFGLVGVAGVVAMTLAGRLADRGHVRAVTGAGTVGLAASWLLLLAAERSLLWLAVGVIALNAAQAAVLASSQHVVYALRPEARNRINSAFMTCFFAGGAVGSALASAMWERAGWPGVCALGAALAAGTVALWALERPAH
jgi:predicted MFS family arabinose efflux permease